MKSNNSEQKKQCQMSPAIFRSLLSLILLVILVVLPALASIQTAQAAATLLSANFDSGTDGFTYQDDAFGTSQPGYASGAQRWPPAAMPAPAVCR